MNNQKRLLSWVVSNWFLCCACLLASLQFFVWIYVTHNLVLSGQSLVFWDEARYFEDAANLYVAKDFFGQLRDSPFPIFSWPVVATLRLFSIPMTYGLLTFLNMLLWQMVFIISIIWLCRILKINSIIGLLVLSFHFSSATAFSTIAMLMGDLSVVGWVFLLFCLLASILKNSKWAFLYAFLAGLIFGCGVQIKTICIMAGLSAVGGLAIMASHKIFLAEKNLRKKFLIDYCVYFLIFLVSIGFTLYLIAPRGLMGLIKLYYYNNEVLGTWKAYEGLYNNFLWLPTVLFEAYPFIGITIGFLIFFWALFTLKINGIKLLGFIKKSDFGSLLFILAPTLVILFYVSFFVVSKPIRPVYFLLPLFLFTSIYFIYYMDNAIIIRYKLLKLRVFNILLASVFVLNCVTTSTWLFAGNGNFTNKILILPKREFKTDIPERKRQMWEDTGLDPIYNHLISESRKEPNSHYTVLVPSYMNTLNSSLLQSLHITLSTISGDKLPHPTPISFIDFTFKYGAWGNFGGFPPRFFANTYLIYSTQGWTQTLPDDALLYPNLLCKMLSENTPTYWDGLTPVIYSKNTSGHDVILAKRTKIASSNSFLKIMKDVASLDPNNLWNLPLLVAAYELEADPLFLTQIEYMLSESFNPPYIIANPLTARQIEYLRAHWPVVPEALHYPNVIEYHPDLLAE